MSYYFQTVLLLSVCAILGQLIESKAHDKLVVCYVGTWAVYRPDSGSFSLENIEPSLCTHIIYSFAGLNVSTDSIKPLDPWNDLPDNYAKDGYGRIVRLREKYPKLKISLAIGGWNEGSANYSQLAAVPARRATFVQNAVQFIRKYKFDGLDLDWEFPGKRGGAPHDKENFVSLVKELHEVFSKQGLLLTAALSAGPETIDVAYNVPAISKYLDFLHLMCYDYHGTWDLRTGANAPLVSNDQLSVEYSVIYMLKLGAPRNKLVLGVPFYGRTFIVKDAEMGIQKLGAPAAPEGFQGPFTREKGFMGYNEICLELQKNSDSWEIHWDALSQTPFATNGAKLIAYDNPRSISEKVRLAQKYRLAGAMVWSMDTDDFNGDCTSNESSEKKGFPLMRAINAALSQPPPPEVDPNGMSNEIPHGDVQVDDGSGAPNGAIFSLKIFAIVVIGLIVNRL